ncbi:MAG TPA: PEPxxWA-CTERM sorting domain-containing protein, partial [Caulobacteraceae bacterium]|nr:PEPxxWA-CTERM sorting domain-containing protein [Caulobacteraceae bacterium]
TIGFSAYAPANGFANIGDAEFSGSIAGVTLVDHKVSSGPETTWQNFTGTATITTAGFYNTSFSFNTDLFPSKDVVIDQAFIVAGGVPEPATWAVMMVGFGGMGAAMRSRRRQAATAA